ncbi:MAG: histidine--tRNA ligase [Pseudolabrys sp.]|nr:histidine--tRNA ligase [Pseudolabrys sp.]
MADKPDKKPSKLKARLPRGLADRGPAEIAATRAMIDTIRIQFEKYGFEALETPAIEYTDALGKFLPDQDRPNEGVFSIQDDDGQWLSLRYDLTAPLARHVAENYQNIALPFRSYRQGWVFRNEKPGPGRFRQFMQFDADTVGSASMAADAEMCMLAADTMEALGIKRGQYVVKVNNRKVLDGVMNAADIAPNKRLIVLRAIDKLDRLGPEGVTQLLGKGRKDESGDYTKGAELTAQQIDRILNFTGWGEKGSGSGSTVGSSAVAIANFETATEGNALGTEGVHELKAVHAIIAAANYTGRVIVDPSVIRGLEYYTGPVYEVELLLQTKDEKGRPVRFGSVGGGGRYDGLVSRFRGEAVPATGFSIGVSRLAAALQLIGKLGAESETGPVVVTVFGPDSVPDAQRLTATLRQAGIRAEMFLGNPKKGVGEQLKYADKRHAPCAVIQGPDEKAQNKVTIKDLAAGRALASGEASRAAHLQKQSEAQRTVPEAELVVAVKTIIGKK